MLKLTGSHQSNKFKGNIFPWKLIHIINQSFGPGRLHWPEEYSIRKEGPKLCGSVVNLFPEKGKLRGTKPNYVKQMPHTRSFVLIPSSWQDATCGNLKNTRFVNASIGQNVFNRCGSFLIQFNITKPNRKFEDGYENGTHCILSNGYYVCLSEKEKKKKKENTQ